MFTLQENDGAQRVWKISANEPLTIGRLPENRVRLEPLKVSRRHAEVRLLSPKQAVIINVSDDNVLRVNEKRVSPQGGQLPLAHGDKIKLGPVVLSVHWTDDTPEGFSDAPLSMGATMSPVQNTGVEALLSSGSGHLAGAGAAAVLQDLRRKAMMLGCLCEMGADLLRVDSVRTILEYATDVVLRTLSVDCCSALLLDEDDEISTVTLRFQSKPAEEVHKNISRTAVRTAIQKRVIIAAQDLLENNSTSERSESVSVQGIGSLACAPLAGRTEVFGALYVDRRLHPEPFSETDQQMLLVVAAQAAAAIEAAYARIREARAAETRNVLARFMPEHLLRELADNPEQYHLGGENKTISVMFCDIRGFSRLAHGMKPQNVVAMLNILFTELAASIMNNSGALNKYLGDGLMALFGAPVSTGQDAVNAVIAAIAMQRSVKRVNEKLAARNLPTLSIGIGINTGEATVGIVGAEMRSEYTAIGSTVNVAARVESLTKGGQILVTQATANELGGRFQLEGPRAEPVKNIPEPVNVYQVIYQNVGGTGEYTIV